MFHGTLRHHHHPWAVGTDSGSYLLDDVFGSDSGVEHGVVGGGEVICSVLLTLLCPVNAGDSPIRYSSRGHAYNADGISA